MIKIPCPNCGCQYCEATTKSGENVRITICRCHDGSGEFDVTIESCDGQPTTYEKYQCSEKDIEHCLTSRFNINLQTMNHNCFN